MPDSLQALRRAVPWPERERCFDPAVADLVRLRRVHRRRASPVIRPALEVWFLFRVAALAVECRRLHRTAADGPDRRRGVDPMIVHDLRFALRVLFKSPGFAVAAVLTLALGIGATTAIYSVVQQVLLRPLPFPEAARVMDVNEAHNGKPFAVSAVNLEDWKARTHAFEALAAYNGASTTLAEGATPERLDGVLVDGAFFDALGVQPMFGRTLRSEDAREGSPKTVVISERLWRRRFGGDPAVIGSFVVFDGVRRAIAGVMPASFDFPEGTDVWFPLILTAGDLAPRQRGAHYLSVVGRVKPGVSLEAARQDLGDIERDLAQRFPRQVSTYTVTVMPLLDALVTDVRQPLLILLGAVACLLLIACVNVSNLLLARATTRSSEMAVRSALGASRRQIVRQLCVESLVLALIGGALGIGLASWTLRLLSAISPANLPRAAGIAIDTRVLLFALLVSTISGVIFGLVPAAIASRTSLVSFLKDRRGGDAGGTRRHLRHVLVGVQVALAVVLLTGAGLAARSFDRLTRVDPGFDATHVLSFNVQLPDGTYPTFDSEAAFFRNFTMQLQQQPGVEAAGAVLFPPLSPLGFGGTVTFPGRTGDAAEGSMQIRSVTPGYFESLRIPLRAGRLPAWTDVRGGAPVVLISEAAARKYWPGDNPIGKPLRIGVSMGVRETQPREVVGVVGDVRISGLDTPAPAVAYVPQDQYAANEMTLMVRANGEPGALLPMVRSVLAAIDGGVAVNKARPLTEQVRGSVSAPRFRMMLLSIFAAAALALAAIGIYATLAFSVNQRRAEIGLRMALGAHRSRVMRLVVREGILPVLIGALAGLAGAAVLTRVMNALLFGVSALDPITFAAVALVLGAVALLACYVPARRAIAVDPVTALRS